MSWAYRGDSRDINDPSMKNGFTMRYDWDRDLAEEYLKLWLGFTLDQLSGKLQKAVLANNLTIGPSPGMTPTGPAPAPKPGSFDPGDFMRFIIAQKDSKRPTISTDLDTGCGGYSSEGHVYKIDISSMSKVAWGIAVPNIKKRPNLLWPELWLDGTTLANSDLIAVLNKRGVKELSFISNIPLNLITKIS